MDQPPYTPVRSAITHVCGLLMLVETLQGESFAANCYLVASETTRRGLVIDPGVQAERILETSRGVGDRANVIPSVPHRRFSCAGEID